MSTPDETISAEELARDLRDQLEAGRSYHDDGKWLAVWGEVIAKALLRLAEVERAQRRCGICGGLVDLRNAEKPTVAFGVGNKSGQRKGERHLAQYARHDMGCPQSGALREPHGTCSCGLSEILARSRPAPQEGRQE